jgi:uncharacterized protein YkwD
MMAFVPREIAFKDDIQMKLGEWMPSMTYVRRMIIALFECVIAAAGAASAQEIAGQVSAYRRAHGLSAVKMDRRLTLLARQQAEAMAMHEAVSHNIVGSFQARMTGVPTHAAAENVAAGFTTFSETLKQWDESPGHHENLLMAGAHKIGVASVAKPSSPYRRFWAMIITD